jgi:hypothetical protein
VVRAISLRLFKRWTRHLNWKHKHFLVALVERMITPILVIAVVSAGFNLFPLSGRLLTVLNRSFYIAILAIGIYCAAKAALILLNQWIESREGCESFREPAQFVVRVVFGAFGTMIVLENLGISLTAVRTTMGVGRVAIALALQDTLSNFFAGVYLRLDQPVRLGDCIKLESGEEGFVVERGWRSCCALPSFFRLDGNMIVQGTNPVTMSLAKSTSIFYPSKLIKPLAAHVICIAMGIPVGTNLKYANQLTIPKVVEGRRGLSPLAFEKLFVCLWRRRFVLLRITPMIESERGIVFRSRNLDLQDSTRVLSLEKWIQCL